MNIRRIRLFILTTLTYVGIAWSSALKPLEPFIANQCVTSDDDIVRDEVSYDKCVDLCKALTGCKAASVWQKSSLCRHHLQIRATTETPGCVYTRKSDWEKKTREGCTETSCPGELQSCHVENGRAVCHVEGCPALPTTLQNGNTFGNKARLGDKRIFKCNKNFILSGSAVRTCEKTGWNGTESGCNGYLLPGVPDSFLSASSTHDIASGFFSPKYGRLNTVNNGRDDGSGAWTAKESNRYQWIQVRFTSMKILTSVALQGRDHANQNQFVKQFNVSYSLDCNGFTTIMDKSGKKKVFPGNTDKHTVVITNLPEEIRALCVRILPITWQGHISLRFDVIGRDAPVTSGQPPTT